VKSNISSDSDSEEDEELSIPQNADACVLMSWKDHQACYEHLQVDSNSNKIQIYSLACDVAL